MDYEPPVAEGCGNREGIPERELAWKSRALEPIRAERTGNWRRELSSRQIQWLEHLGSIELARGGYTLSGASRTRFSPALATALTWGLSRLVLHLPLAWLAHEITACAPHLGTRQSQPRPLQGAWISQRSQESVSWVIAWIQVPTD